MFWYYNLTFNLFVNWSGRESLWKSSKGRAQGASWSDAQTILTDTFSRHKQLHFFKLAPDDGASHRIYKAESSELAEEAHFGCLCLGSHLFGRDLDFITIDEGFQFSQMSKLRTLMFSLALSWPQQTRAAPI